MKIFLAHLILQLKIGVRDGAYVFSTILVPAGVYWFFAVPESKNDYLATYLICSFSAFAFFGVVFFQYSVSTAHEKTSSWAQWTRTLPYPMITPLLARFVTSVCFGTLACLLIFGIGHAFTPTEMSIPTFAQAMGLLTLGSFPFLVFGIYCGSIFSSKAIVPVANFIYLVLSFTGGLWKPPEILPKVLKDLCPYIPTYHYGRLVWSIPSPDQSFEWKNALYLLGFTAVFLVLLLLKERTGQFRFKRS